MYLLSLKKGSRSYLLILFCLLSISVFGQKTKAQLEREKQENIRKIRETGNLLKETQTQKNSGLAQLAVLKKEIDARNQLIASITQEIELLNRDIYEINDLIASLESDLIALREEYANMIYEAAKTQTNYDKLTFIFSSTSFNQLVMRLKYLQQFADARKYQVEQIGKVKLILDTEKTRLATTIREKNELLQAKKIEQQNLNNLEIEQSDLIANLSNKEKQLKKQVAETQKENRKLEKLIEDIVKREIAKAKRAAELKERERAKAIGSKATESANMVLSTNFAANAKKLPWPVARGEIVSHFGKQPHPVLKGVTVENLGIDIVTLKEEAVRSVFSGKVVTIASVPGLNNVVMIQHGEYYTVYARLKSVQVKNGQEVAAKELIGQVYTDKDGQTQLQFQIWKNSDKLDPEMWIYKK
jgi:septal ring factor EnvC (AmiA/AmiB activator)